MSAGRVDVRARLTRIATFLGGIYFFFYFVCPESMIEQWGIQEANEPISNGFIVVGTMAIGLGIINIISAHGSKVIFKRRGWQYSVALLVGFLAIITTTTAQWIESVKVSKRVHAVQVIGDFAQRIIEDDQIVSGRKEGMVKSASPAGALPPVGARISALVSYSNLQLRKINSEVNESRAMSRLSQAESELLNELEQASRDLEASAIILTQIPRDSLRSEDEAALQAFSQKAARLASAFSLVMRKNASTSLSQRVYDLLYNGVFNQLGSAMFALLGVYIAAAAYRAFRIRSVESALMMIAALIVMLGQISFGKHLYSEMPAIRQWLLEVPNSAAFRAIRLGAGVAGLMLAIRMWLSIESTSFTTRNK